MLIVEQLIQRIQLEIRGAGGLDFPREAGFGKERKLRVRGDARREGQFAGAIEKHRHNGHVLCNNVYYAAVVYISV